MTVRNDSANDPGDSAQPVAPNPPRGTGWKFIAICIGFAITLLSTVAIMLYIFLNTKAFD